jgi:hypothetical protein
MTQSQLERLCRTWQRRLRLSDWDVSVRIASLEEMGDEVGHIDYEDEQIWAEIRLLECPEIEANLVHELLHLRLDGWAVEYHDPEKEKAINLLADCYLRAYPRRGRKAE